MPAPDPDEGLPWDILMVTCRNKIGVEPKDFWKLTFAEFWPMYNAATKQMVRPMSSRDLRKLNERYLKRGKSRGTSSQPSS